MAVDKIFYSPQTNSFYPSSLMKLYTASNSLPEDIFEVEEDVFNVFGLTYVENKERAYSSDKGFYWKDRLLDVSTEDVKASELVWIKLELDRARDELEKVQDSDSKAVGTVAAWREYRKALRSWSEHEDFPNKEKRPVSPDA